MEDGKVVIKIQGDISELNKSLEKAEKDVKHFGTTVTDASSNVSEAFNDVSDKTVEMKGKIEETSEDIGNMSDTAGNVAGSLSDLSEATNEIADSLGNAESATGDFAETAEDLSAAVDGTTQNFNNLPVVINDVSASLESMGARGDVFSGSLNEQAKESSFFVEALNFLREVLTDTKSSIEDVSKALSQNNSELEKNTKDISKNAQTMATMQKAKAVYQAVSEVIKKTVAVCKELIDVYAVQEQAETRLEAINNAMGESVGYTTAQLKDMASALQGNSTFGDEIIMGAQKTLLALGTLNKEGFEKALQASADLAAAMGTDIDSAAQSLSQALLDPENGLRRLRTEGIAFTDAEKEQIKTLVEAGKTQEAQMFILDKVESKYKGMAKAIADTDTGKLKQISNTWGDIKENLGEKVLDTISPWLDAILNRLNKIQEKTKEGVKASKANNSVLRGESSLKDYSTEELEKMLSAAEERNAFLTQPGDPNGPLYEYIEQLETAIKRRKELDEADKRYDEWKRKRAEALAEQQKDYVLSLEEQKKLEEDAAKRNETRTKVSAFLDEHGIKTEKEAIEEVKREAEELRTQLIDTDQAYNGNKPVKAFQDLNAVITDCEEKLKNLAGDPLKDLLSEFGSLSQSLKVDEIEENINRIKSAMGGADETTRKYFEEAISSLEAEKKALTETEDPIQAMINQYGHLSETFQELEKTKVVEELQRLRDALEEGSEQARILDEILKNIEPPDLLTPDLQKGVNAFTLLLNKTLGETSTTYGQVFQSVSSSFGDMLSAMSDMRSRFLQNEIDSLQAELDARLEANEITQEEEKKLMEAIDNAKAKQFESEKRNSIAQAVINGALGITSIWSTQGAVPWLAAALSAMLSATTAAQIATISSQSYQGFERGGIVGGSGITGDKHPIFANAGELILTRAQQANIAGQLTQSSSPIISVNFSGNVFGDEKSISEYVYNGIRNAQREGALAQW